MQHSKLEEQMLPDEATHTFYTVKPHFHHVIFYQNYITRVSRFYIPLYTNVYSFSYKQSY